MKSAEDPNVMTVRLDLLTGAVFLTFWDTSSRFDRYVASDCVDTQSFAMC